MLDLMKTPAGRSGRETAALEAVSLLAGLTITAALFFGIAHFKAAPAPQSPPIEDLRLVSLPPEPPPPKIVPPAPQTDSVVPFAGLEVGASDSPVKIAVLPPDLASLVPRSSAPPPAVIQTAQLVTTFKPRTEANFDVNHIYQPGEVDQRTTVLARPTPLWPPEAGGKVNRLRVVFLMIVNAQGTAENVRLMSSSGFASFDEQVAQQIREEWVFAPAIKNGRKVRCFVQQAVVVSQSRRSPFEL